MEGIMEFRKMRRNRQELSKEMCEDILFKGTSGVLALLGDNDYPYALPISYVYDGDKLYFHSSLHGHKIDAIKRSEKASFCVVDKDEIRPLEYTTYFRSIIAFGKIRIIENDDLKREAIQKLAIKYAPNDSELNRNKEIEKDSKQLCMLEMCIEHLTGKEAIELVRGRNM